MEYYESIDPYRGESLARKALNSDKALAGKVNRGAELNPFDPKHALAKRLKAVQKLAASLRADSASLARMMSKEMGKPLKEAQAEVKKCAWLCDYYFEEAEEILQDQKLELGEAQVIRRYEPLGLVLGVMPWNFPFWQVFRFAVPAIIAGNRVLLKHAPNCVLSAEALENLFQESGLDPAFYQAVYLSNDQVAELLKNPLLKAVSLTGSTQAGKAVAQIAAANLKPQLLELGGSNAFILHESADVQKAAKLASTARLMNAGQSCIAAKRFLVPKNLEQDFIEALCKEFENYKMGDPLEEGTDIGPLARRDLKEKAEVQVERSLVMGARLEFGDNGEGNFITPTILSNVNAEMPVFKEEVFAPVAGIMAYQDFDEAVKLSNQSPYGLGVSLVGEDLDFLMKQVSRFKEGAVFINELVKSDPRLPFGGVKNSGYGRELGPEGLRSFTNLKTIYRKGKLE